MSPFGEKSPARATSARFEKRALPYSARRGGTSQATVGVSANASPNAELAHARRRTSARSPK